MFTLLQVISLRCRKQPYLALSYPAMRDNFYGFGKKITVDVLAAGCQLLYYRKFYRYLLQWTNDSTAAYAPKHRHHFEYPVLGYEVSNKVN